MSLKFSKGEISIFGYKTPFQTTQVFQKKGAHARTIAPQFFACKNEVLWRKKVLGKLTQKSS